MLYCSLELIAKIIRRILATSLGWGNPMNEWDAAIEAVLAILDAQSGKSAGDPHASLAVLTAVRREVEKLRESAAENASRSTVAAA